MKRILAALLLLSAPALAHEAGPLMPPGVKQAQVVQTFPQVQAAPSGKQPGGWVYGWECCSGMDCSEISTSAVHETKNGYVVDGSKDQSPVSYNDKRRIKLSKDEHYHWCSHKAGPDEGKTICLYVPDKGY